MKIVNESNTGRKLLVKYEEKSFWIKDEDQTLEELESWAKEEFGDNVQCSIISELPQVHSCMHAFGMTLRLFEAGKTQEEVQDFVIKHFKYNFPASIGTDEYCKTKTPYGHENTMAFYTDSLSGGKMLRRKSWQNGTFIFKQFPTRISVEKTVPNMQSLPQSVIDEFKRRFDETTKLVKNDSAHNHSTISYQDQIALVKADNTITSYTHSNEDLFAKDWEMYTN